MSQARSYPCRRVVITGGEPLESSLFSPLVSALQDEQFEIEVETSGTVEPPRGQAGDPVERLGQAGRRREWKRAGGSTRRPFGRFLEYHAWWKFVVAGDEDLAEALRLAERFALPRERILLQPEALRREELIERSPWVIEACKRHGFRFSPRLHVMTWGARRGV